MDGYSEVYDNFVFLMITLGKLSGTRYAGCRPGVALYDSGVPDAYENYALLEPGPFSGGAADAINRSMCETIRHGLEFFAGNKRAHIWPIFPGVTDEAREILEDNGLVRDEDFHAMLAETSETDPDDADLNLVATISGDNEACKWAGCAWRGFDLDGEPPAPFVSNVKGMSRMDAFTLVHIEMKATGMLYSSGINCGAYYVATGREFRGQGLAGTIVEGLKSRARRLGFRRVVLLATPSGLRLYRKHGFEEAGTVEIYRMDCK